MSNESKMLEVLIAAFIAALLLPFLMAFPIMWISNYLFTPDFLLFVIGGAMTYWKAFFLAFLIGLLGLKAGAKSG